MKVISPANETVMQILKNFKKPGTSYRKIKYLVETEVDEGILLFNLFTRELLLMTKEEYENALDDEYLMNQWFVIPDECKEKEYVDLIKHYLRSKQPNLEEITNYTIFTTSDCNARCFYCFELGRARTPMKKETALQVAVYIKEHCANKRVTICWFGGEPLMNTEAIEIICNYLKNNNISYVSRMISNGYLFNDDIIRKAKELWNLKHVQITLDGTEQNYNKIKAYIYKSGNPYQIVMSNIKKLLDAAINVRIRLNMDLHNADDLLELTKELAKQFSGKKNIIVYAHHLFNQDIPMAEQHTPEEWQKRESAMLRIDQIITQNGLDGKTGISTKFQVHHCKADSGTAVTILPDGNIGLCEHCIDGEYIGHINNQTYDKKMIASFKELMSEVPECKTCFYYPECVKIKKCTTSSVCYTQYRESMLRNTKKAINNQYNQWLKSLEQTRN